MKILLFAFTTLLAFHRAFLTEFELDDREVAASQYIKQVMNEILKLTNKVSEASWNFGSNMTNDNEAIYTEAYASYFRFVKYVRHEIQAFDWPSLNSSDLRSQFKMLSTLGVVPNDALNENEANEYLQAFATLKKKYTSVRVCDFNNRTKCNLSALELAEIFAESRNLAELTYYWRDYYDKAGTPVRHSYEKYIELKTKAAQLNNFTSAAEEWLNEYGENMDNKLEEFFRDIKPLYKQLHAYVRHRLQKFYGQSVVSTRGPIPMHLLGNIWADEWNNIMDIVMPYPQKPTINITEQMVQQGYTPLKMYQMGDDFFTSMNLMKLTPTFWEKSIIEKPKDGRTLICHGSAMELYKQDDVRIRFCTRVNHEDFLAVHHELGHIQYFLQYQHQPFPYRNGANKAFHEAIGEVMALSASTPKHLERIGLLKNYVYDEETRINRLLLTALSKIVVLPASLSIDKYRFALFRGQIEKTRWNCAYWKMREEYCGVEPPVMRSESDFDPPAKIQVSFNVDTLRYFVAYIMQFQFYKSACIKAGQYDANNPQLPLDNCDFYGSHEVGKAFHDMLSLGSSKPWPDVMEVLTGDREMSGRAIAEYFEPLRIWLEAENIKNNVSIGWSASEKCIQN